MFSNPSCYCERSEAILNSSPPRLPRRPDAIGAPRNDRKRSRDYGGTLCLAMAEREVKITVALCVSQ